MSDPIKHVIVLTLENHSFDQMLGCMKSLYPTLEGVSPAAPFCNPNVSGGPVCQAASTLTTIADDPGHDLDNVLRQITGPCQGFVSDFAHTFPQSGTPERQEVISAIAASARAVHSCCDWSRFLRISCLLPHYPGLTAESFFPGGGLYTRASFDRNFVGVIHEST